MLKNVVCLAAEAKWGGLFMNGQKAIEIKKELNALGHKQTKIEIKKTIPQQHHLQMIWCEFEDQRCGICDGIG